MAIFPMKFQENVFHVPVIVINVIYLENVKSVRMDLVYKNQLKNVGKVANILSIYKILNVYPVMSK